jgi:hypothetical protein
MHQRGNFVDGDFPALPVKTYLIRAREQSSIAREAA